MTHKLIVFSIEYLQRLLLLILNTISVYQASQALCDTNYLKTVADFDFSIIFNYKSHPLLPITACLKIILLFPVPAVFNLFPLVFPLFRIY